MALTKSLIIFAFALFAAVVAEGKVREKKGLLGLGGGLGGISSRGLGGFGDIGGGYGGIGGGFGDIGGGYGGIGGGYGGNGYSSIGLGHSAINGNGGIGGGLGYGGYNGWQ